MRVTQRDFLPHVCSLGAHVMSSALIVERERERESVCVCVCVCEMCDMYGSCWELLIHDQGCHNPGWELAHT